MRNNFFAQLVERWRTLTGSQQSALAIGVLILLVIAGVAVNLATTPHYAQLYGNLSDADAANVISRLKELKVDYRLTGNNIEVPQDRSDELRLTLAGEGKPQGGNAGFELFDKTQFGESEFGEHLRYIRALQGELQRTIELLDSVQSARVHLVLPEHRLLSTEQQVPTASVLLVLRHGQPPTKEVRTVIHLVSSAVEGLDPANVTVTDSMGDVLSELPGVTDDTAVETRMDMQHKVARDIESRVQSMLDQVLGPNKALVRASVTMNFTRAHVENETYTPVNAAPVTTSNGTNGVNTATITGPITGVMESEQRTTETYSGEKAAGAFGTPATGATFGGIGNTRTGSNNAYNRSENTTQYRVSKKIERQEVAPGQVERVSLAVLVDQSVSAQQINNLNPTIVAAAGLDTRPQGRGDKLSIQPVTFDTTATQKADQEAAVQQQHTQTASYLKLGGSALLILVFLLLVWAMYRASLTPVVLSSMPRQATAALEAPQTYAMLTPPLSTNGDTEDALATFTHVPAPANELPPANLTPEEAFMYQQLNPLRVAQVVKDMLAEDK